MKAVILAGGLGTRLRPFTEIIPKPLLPVGEKSVLEIQIERLKKFGFDEIFLATNYKSDYIENFFGDGSRYGVKLYISKEEKPLSTAGPIKLLKEKLDDDDFLVMNGDILSLIDFNKFYSFAQDKNTIFTIAIKKEILPFAFGNIFFNGDFVTGIEEKPNIITYILAGIYFMKPKIFDYIPDNQSYGIDDLIKDLLKLNIPISKYEMNEYWLDLGRISDYEKAQKDFNNIIKEEK